MSEDGGKRRSARPQGRGRMAEAGIERHSGRKQRGRYRGRAKTENDLPDVSMISKFASIECPYCGEPIRDITGALAHRESGEPAHFECVLKILEEQEPHEQNETIVYIGHGNFAVAAFGSTAGEKRFKIVRVIEWEDKNTTPEWRSSILDYYDLSKPSF